MIKKNLIALILLPFFLAGGFAQCDTSIHQVIPSFNKSSGWMISEQQIYLGDDLFYLINGGAELYFEYGFEEVAALNFKNDQEDRLYVEIYEMKDPLAAFGIYSLFSSKYESTTGEGLIDIDGQHLFLCKDRYFVMIRKSKGENNAKLQQMAGIISNIIPLQSTIPAWPDKKIISAGNYTDFYLIRGIIGLNNHYYFGQEDIFDFDAGLVIKYPEKQFINLYYPREEKVEEIGRNIKDFLASSGNYETSAESENIFYDKKGQQIQYEQKGNFLILTINKSKK